LKLDGTGNPHIAYQDSSTNPQTLNYASSNGSAWTIQTVDNYPSYLSLALHNGNPHISYSRLGVGLNYATSNGTSWTIETVTNSVQYTSIAVDASGNPRISYYEPNNKDLWYAYRDGSGWHTQKVDETGDMGAYCSLALDTSGNPRISYLDGANFRLKYASYDGASWTFETADSTSGAGYYTSLAMDSSGNAHISYSTSSNWLKYANGAVPEASTWLLFGVGLAVLAAWRRRRR
jgi:hypothetical protein